MTQRKKVVVHAPEWCQVHLSYKCLCFDRAKETFECDMALEAGR